MAKKKSRELSVQSEEPKAFDPTRRTFLEVSKFGRYLDADASANLQRLSEDLEAQGLIAGTNHQALQHAAINYLLKHPPAA